MTEQISYPEQSGRGLFEVTYITFGRLMCMRFETLSEARRGFEIAHRLHARLWINPHA